MTSINEVYHKNDSLLTTNIPLEVLDSKNNMNEKSMELFEENEAEKPPLSKFLNQIINFHSIMPSSKEMNDKLENGNEVRIVVILIHHTNLPLIKKQLANFVILLLACC
jgi:hypothetical protein